MRYPEKVFDGPGHQRAGYRINQTNYSNRNHRADVLCIKHRNNMGEEEAWQSDILSKIGLVSSSATHDINIIVG